MSRNTIRYITAIAASILALAAVSGCGSDFMGLPNDKDLNNPVDPKVSSNTSQTGGPTSNGGKTGGGTTTSCVDDCTSPSTTNTFSLKEANFFNPSTASCQLGNAVALVSAQLNQITVIYRANYSSVGMWKLYGKRFSVAGDGSMALLDSSPVDLYPECFGNTAGVTAFSITGYKSSQVATKTLYKYWEFDAANQNLTHVKVNVTCTNSTQSGSKTFNLTAGIATSFDTPTLYSTTTGWHGGTGYQSGWNGASTSATTSPCYYNYSSSEACLFERSPTYGEIGTTNYTVKSYKAGILQTTSDEKYNQIGYSLFRNDKFLTMFSGAFYTLNLANGTWSSLYGENITYNFWPKGWYGTMGMWVDLDSPNKGRLLLTSPFF